MEFRKHVQILNENFSKKNMHILVGFYLYELSSKSFISAWEEQRCGHYEAKFFWKWHMNFHMHFWVCCLLTASTDFQGTKHALLYKGFGHQVPDPSTGIIKATLHYLKFYISNCVEVTGLEKGIQFHSMSSIQIKFIYFFYYRLKIVKASVLKFWNSTS